MREILFRGKRVDNGSWVYGDFTKPCNIVWIEEDKRLNNDLVIFDEKVQEETLGQYTGLKDKSGKKIFEGDIVRKQTFGKMRDISTYENEKEFKEHKRFLIKKNGCIFDSEYEYHHNYDYVVEWELNGFYPFADSPENCGHCGGAENNLECEVIGNIYDNPELLEGDK